MNNPTNPNKDELREQGALAHSATPKALDKQADTPDSYAKLQEIYLKWHKGRRPLSGFINEVQGALASAPKPIASGEVREQIIKELQDVFVMGQAGLNLASDSRPGVVLDSEADNILVLLDTALTKQLDEVVRRLPERLPKLYKARQGVYPNYQPQVESHRREGFNEALGEVLAIVEGMRDGLLGDSDGPSESASARAGQVDKSSEEA